MVPLTVSQFTIYSNLYFNVYLNSHQLIDHLLHPIFYNSTLYHKPNTMPVYAISLEAILPSIVTLTLPLRILH